MTRVNSNLGRFGGSAIFLSLLAGVWVGGPTARGAPLPTSQPASGPAELAHPATQIANPPQPGVRAGNGINRPVRPYSDLERLQSTQNVFANRPAVGDFQIGDLLHGSLDAEGSLQIEAVGFRSIHGQQRIQVRGVDPAIAKATWVAIAQGSAGDAAQPNVYVIFDRYDFDQTSPGQMWAVELNVSKNYVQIQGRGIGFFVHYIEMQGPGNQKTTQFSVSPTGGGPKEFSDTVSLQARSLANLQLRDPVRVRKYLEPMLTRILGHDPLLPGAGDCYSAFTKIPADPQVAKAVMDILPRLEADSFDKRETASAELAKLGAPGVLAVLRLDLSTLSQEQKTRCAAFVRTYRIGIFAFDDADTARHDPIFLLGALEDDDPAVRQASKAQIEQIVAHAIAFDAAAEFDARRTSLDAQRESLHKEITAKTAPTAPATAPAASGGN